MVLPYEHHAVFTMNRLLWKVYGTSVKLHVICQKLLYIAKYILSTFPCDVLYKHVDHFIVLLQKRNVLKSFKSPGQFMVQKS